MILKELKYLKIKIRNLKPPEKELDKNKIT